MAVVGSSDQASALSSWVAGSVVSGVVAAAVKQLLTGVWAEVRVVEVMVVAVAV